VKVLSNAIIEAMACGLPTIATAVGGNTELVEAGLTGFLVPPRAPDQIALAMVELLTRPELSRSMGRHARRRAVGQFSLPGMIAGYASFYQRSTGAQPLRFAITHLRSSSGLYGAEHMILELCRQQARHYAKTRLLVFAPDGQGPTDLLLEARSRQLPVAPLPCLGPVDPGCILDLRRRLRADASNNRAVLHCHDYKSVVYGGLASAGLPITRIATLHGWLEDRRGCSSITGWKHACSRDFNGSARCRRRLPSDCSSRAWSRR
jgi:hypothetical protein